MGTVEIGPSPGACQQGKVRACSLQLLEREGAGRQRAAGKARPSRHPKRCSSAKVSGLAGFSQRRDNMMLASPRIRASHPDPRSQLSRRLHSRSTRRISPRGRGPRPPRSALATALTSSCSREPLACAANGNASRPTAPLQDALLVFPQRHSPGHPRPEIWMEASRRSRGSFRVGLHNLSGRPMSYPETSY